MADKIVGDVAAKEFVTKAKAAYNSDIIHKFGRATDDDFPDDLFIRSELDCTNYASKNIANYATVTEIPDADITEIKRHEVTNYSNAFAGMAALTSTPKFDTSQATSIAGMYKDCKALKEVDYIFNCSNITSVGGVLGVLEGTAVTTARFDNVPDGLISAFTAANLGSQLTRIIINGYYKG